MLAKTFATTVILAFLAGAEAARPTEFKIARAPASSLFGLMRRDDCSAVYEPETEVCTGGGDTCASACGAGYEMCADNHCYNPAAGDSCCTVGNGNACGTGYYCTHDANQNTVCYPEEIPDVDTCSKSVTSDGPKKTAAPTSTSSSSSSTPSTTSTSSSSSSSSSSISLEFASSSKPVFAQSSSSIAFATSSSYKAPSPTGSNSDSGSDSDSDSGSDSGSGSDPATTPLVPASAAGNKAALALVVGFFFFALF